MTGVLRGAIGVFDSGVGGLSTLRAIHEAYPHEHLIYVADSGHAPYGDQPAGAIIERAQRITQFLLDQPCKAVVVACNTASVLALPTLRAMTTTPIIGMEPAIKPAAQATRSGVIGVLATQRTIGSESVQRLVAHYASHVRVVLQACPGLVEQVEAGHLDTPETVRLLRAYLSPLCDAGVDQVVLGCTHYYFLRETIARLVGPSVNVLEPAQAIARQLGARSHLLSGLREGDAQGGFSFFSSARNLDVAGDVMARLWGMDLTGQVRPLPV